MCSIWPSAVRWAITSAAAISLLLSPCATSWAISVSRRVSGDGRSGYRRLPGGQFVLQRVGERLVVGEPGALLDGRVERRSAQRPARTSASHSSW